MRLVKALLIALLINGFAIADLSFGASEALLAKQTGQQSSLTALQRIFQPRRRPAGTRGPICLITPGLRPAWISLSEIPFILSDRPLFIWQKPIARVKVIQADNNTLVWDQSLSPNSHRISYQGSPLQPGQAYQVIAFGSKNEPLNNEEDAQFIVVEANQQKEIVADLAAIETEFRNQNYSEEAIAIAKATALSKRSLLSDAFQLLDAVPNRSPELDAFLTKTASKVCNQE
jgi:hypothetical protein